MKPIGSRAGTCFAVLLLSLTSSTLLAADFATGLDAFDQSEYRKAIAEFKPLAEAGNARAEYRLGTLYAIGRGIARDYDRALTWLRKCAFSNIN